MKNKLVPYRYAKSLLKLTYTPESDGERYLDALAAVRELFGHQQAKSVLQSPVMPKTVKKQLLSYALREYEEERPLLERFLFLMVDVGRVSAVSELFGCYQELVDQAKNRRRATIVSAVPLEKKAKEEFVSALETKMSCKIIAAFKHDAKILGGAVVYVGNELLDMSLKTRLLSVTQ